MGKKPVFGAFRGGFTCMVSSKIADGPQRKTRFAPVVAVQKFYERRKE
jgi:hypothetical protein